jgi:ABC-type transport system substrate-binding protein
LEIPARLTVLEPTDSLDVTQAEAAEKLRELIYDHLVRLDTQGQPQPAIALSWEHDATTAKWRFKIRPGVKWQDGAPLTVEEVATALEGKLPNASVRVGGDAVEIGTRGPSPSLLTTLATNPNLSIRRIETTSGGLPLPIGTGPFRLTTWEAGNHAVLQANDDYWDGRAYVDTIEIQMGRASRDAQLDLELGKADVVELDPVEARRVQQDGKKVWSSATVELLCLRFSAKRAAVQDRRLRQALADAIDRTAIQKVLLQNYGEAAGSIFPQWLSGYTFLFPPAMDLDQARQLRAEIGAMPALKIGYDAGDILARQTAERVAVNARDVGITLAVAPLPAGSGRTPDGDVDLEVERLRIDGPTLGEAARQAASSLGLPANGEGGPEQDYAAERQFLDTLTVVPLIHIPDLLGIGPRVMDWSATPWGAWRLEFVSLGGEKP